MSLFLIIIHVFAGVVALYGIFAFSARAFITTKTTWPPLPETKIPIPMPIVKPPLRRSTKVDISRGSATYDISFDTYIVITSQNPIHFAKEELYIRKEDLEKILKELKPHEKS